MFSRKNYNPRMVPSGPFELNWNHPLSQGLVALYVAGRVDDLTGNGPPLITEYRAGQHGIAFLSGVANEAPIPQAYRIGEAVSIFAIAEIYLNYQTFVDIGLTDVNNSFNTFYQLGINGYEGIFFYYNNGQSGIPGQTSLDILWNASTNPFTASKQYVTMSGTLKYGGMAKLYTNGALNVSQVAPVGPAYNGVSAVIAPAYASTNVIVPIAGWYNIELSADMTAWLHAEPFAMLKPVKPRTLYSFPTSLLNNNSASIGKSTFIYVIT